MGIQAGLGTIGAGYLARLLLGALVVGSMTVVVVLSLAAIVYSGPLAAYLDQGIALALIGSIAMSVVAPLALSYRGGIIQPQNVAAILLSFSAAEILRRTGGDAEAAFPTVVATVAAASIATGAAAYAAGALRLGYLVRFVPFPVVSGFLAATGALLAGHTFHLLVPSASAGAGGWTAALAERWPLWLPWMVLAALMTVIMRRTGNGTVIPAILAAALGLFYLAVWALGLDTSALRDSGIFLGPFAGSSFAAGLSLDLPLRADWSLVATQLPVILTIVAICLLGNLLAASSLELAIRREIDLEHDLKGVGLANLAAGFGGGIAGYHIIGRTLLARRLGITGAAVCILTVPICVATLFFGAELLSWLPVGLFAAVIWYLGFDLMLAAIVDNGLRMPRLDFSIVLITPVIALLFGIMEAVAFGVAAAALLFLVAYAGVDIVRLSTTAGSFRSRVERSPREMERLAAIGGRVHIHRLSGFVFFGSASRLVERLDDRSRGEAAPRIVVIDLARVSGLDMTAWAAFERLSRRAAQNGTRLLLTGLSPALRTRFARWMSGLGGSNIEFAGDLDAALEVIEEDLLREAGAAPAAGRREDPGEAAFAALLERYGERVAFGAGETLLGEGAQSDHLLVLADGRCRAVAAGGGTLRRFLPGAIIGEIAYYAGGARTATVLAETPGVAIRIGADALARMERERPADAAAFHARLATALARRLAATTRLLGDAEV